MIKTKISFAYSNNKNHQKVKFLFYIIFYFAIIIFVFNIFNIIKSNSDFR